LLLIAALIMILLAVASGGKVVGDLPQPAGTPLVPTAPLPTNALTYPATTPSISVSAASRSPAATATGGGNGGEGATPSLTSVPTATRPPVTPTATPPPTGTPTPGGSGY
jgi:hypothetical protein